MSGSESIQSILRRWVHLALVGACAVCWGDRVVLKDGLELEGTLGSGPFQIAVRSPLKTYYLSARQLARPEAEPPTEAAEVFFIPQSVPRAGKRLPSQARARRPEPFDPFGRRTLALEGPKGENWSVIQGITELHPTHAIVEGLNYSWTSPLALAEISPQELFGILERAVRPDEIVDQIKGAHFLIQAGRLADARDRIELMAKRFPEEATRIEPLRELWGGTVRSGAARAIDRALAAGQLDKARLIVEEVNKGLPSTAPDPNWEEHLQRVTRGVEDLARAKRMISESLDALAPSEGIAPLADAAEEISAELSYATLERVRPMLALGTEPSSTPAERLSLALTGWLAGPTLATGEVEKALAWLADRKLIASALSARGEGDFEIAVDRLKREIAFPTLVPEIIPRLAATDRTTSAGVPTRVEVRADKDAPLDYQVVLPSEYQPTGSYAMIVALHGTETTSENQLAFWKGPAESLGAVLVAPRYLLGEHRGYEYSLAEHERVLDVLADARQRFAIDGNRVFLTGHEVGAFAAYDLAMSHPDEWAGLVAISGLPRFYSKYYWRNLAHLPIFAVDGELNGDNPALMRGDLSRWFKERVNVIYAEYAGRGGGRYDAELPVIVDWMSRQRRDPFPPSVVGVSARHSDTRFYWLEMKGFGPNTTIPPQLFGKTKGVRPARVEGSRGADGSLVVESHGVGSVRIHLSPKLLALDDDGLTIKVNGKVAHQGKLAPDLGTLLGEVRRTGDRARLTTNIIEAN